ncbi:MAG: hypothetical protein NXI04_25770 [Planctomycetaceae bacterium]|nr:hypothetical protein [Planctomycetaceae bacterium]
MNRLITFLLLITLALPSSAMAGKQRRLQRKAARRAAKCAPVCPPSCLRPYSTFTDSCGRTFYVDECCRLIPFCLPLTGAACPVVKLGEISGGGCLWLVQQCGGSSTATMAGECHDPCECGTDNLCSGCPTDNAPGPVNQIPGSGALALSTRNMRANTKLNPAKFKNKKSGDVKGSSGFVVTPASFIVYTTTPQKYFALYTFEKGGDVYRFALRCKKDFSSDRRKLASNSITRLNKNTRNDKSEEEASLTHDGKIYHLIGLK